MTTTACPPLQPCFCPTADIPVAATILPQGTTVAAEIPIYGSQPFSVRLVTNPTLPIANLPLAASVQIIGGNILTVTTNVAAPLETEGTYTVQVEICNACGKLTLDIPFLVAPVITPVITNCLLAQALWTPEARVPAAGDTLLAFTPAGCRALLPPISTCEAIQAMLPAVAPVTGATRLVTNACDTITVQQILDLVDVCAEIQLFPVATPLQPTDQFVILQGATCAKVTVASTTAQILAALDICELLQNLPNAVVQPTAVFYGQQGGSCFEFAVSDLCTLCGGGGVTFPILADNGSCAAPSYSFTSSPTDGLWNNLGIVTLSAANCVEMIQLGGGSIDLTSSGTISSNAAGGFQVNATGNVNINGQNVIANSNTALSLIGNGGATQAVMTASGHWSLSTGTTSRLSVRVNGEWQLAGDPGVAGQVLTSQGPGLPPVWA